MDARNEPTGLIREGDTCIFFNYRADRGRQMTQALMESPLKLHFTTMTQYDKTLTARFVLTKEHPNNILANVMAEQWKNPARRRDRKNMRTLPIFLMAALRSRMAVRSGNWLPHPRSRHMI